MGHGRTDELRKDAVRIALTSGLSVFATLPVPVPLSQSHSTLSP